MTELVTRKSLTQFALVMPEFTPAPTVAEPTVVDRSFELPTALYVVTAGAYFGFVGLMAASFGNPGLAIPLAVCAVFVAMFFGVAAMWTRMQPDNPRHPLTTEAFRNRGIQTLSGSLTAAEATIQVLILPLLIFAWGVAIAVIAASVS